MDLLTFHADLYGKKSNIRFIRLPNPFWNRFYEHKEQQVQMFNFSRHTG